MAVGAALGERWLVVGLAEDVTVRLRCDLFQHLQGQSDAFFSAARPGALVSRLSGDVQGVRFPRDAGRGGRGSDGSHERSPDDACPEEIPAGVA
ncbi:MULTISPECIES: ABC transporter transmembrane domain-containing protein [Streptomyces violaceusniger group]|uniref:ABC transporter transmembrane domain-containing protein n=1 Tax=Streptomyces violaceusniger group TaxID=2839105 RepID=UPI0035563C91